MGRKRSPKQRLLAFAHGFILFIACLVVVVPLTYLVINSVKLPREFLTVPPTILPIRSHVSALRGVGRRQQDHSLFPE